jgi:pSer/pThr/pTyr-binding forkhead associated (FHA) protein
VEVETILVSAGVSILSGAITAYFTTRFRMKEEREKWKRDFALKMAQMEPVDSALAQRMAVQFALGVLIYQNPDTSERERIFLPPHCRLVAGRANTNQIFINDAKLSRQHCAFDSDETNVYVEDLGSANATFMNGSRVAGRVKLNTGDVISLGDIEFQFHKLDRR